jgi:hypothetical protein
MDAHVLIALGVVAARSGLKAKLTGVRYYTTNSSDDATALGKRDSLLVWLNGEMIRLAPRAGPPGRPSVLFDAAVQFCPSIEVPRLLEP